MFGKVLKKVFGTANEREVKKFIPLVKEINAFEDQIQKKSDLELQEMTQDFRARLKEGSSLDSLLPEAFAVVREASKRILGMRHYDVQMMGGIVLHRGNIAEMKTGEGKTLVATLPIYLNALSGQGVHVITVNDYLARRDAEWMGRLYRFLGLSVGSILHGMNDAERKQAYASDIVYGTNNEFGFDYLRDNMKFSLEDYVQRELNFALVDEVDSVLIDESRTPLIISGPAEVSTNKYNKINQVVPALKAEEHFKIDEKSKTIVLTEDGVRAAEKLLKVENLYDPRNIEILHHVNQALKAHHLYKKEVDYLVKDGQVIIVDEFTGRLMEGRRWSDGLHQAVEAKEGVTIENENQTLATITFQNYFRLYNKLAGMTGTADTEAEEFHKIYSLGVLVIPTNKPLARKDENDLIYKNTKAKFKAVADEIEEYNKKGQPILVGTINIDTSEVLSQMLKRRGVKHHVLNAKQHEKEAEIIAQAGRLGSVTIATNMAGRGTDIVLGGNVEFLARASLGANQEDENALQKEMQKFEQQCEAEKKEVLNLGGLRIIGTERHESRRIDNQLRGRAGRQGDPGFSRFYISLEDDLMRIFGSERIAKMMERLNMDEDEAIEHSWISKAIENAQKKVEAHHFDIRKNLLEYDDVMNQQRKTVYTFRREILEGKKIDDKFLDLVDQVCQSISDLFANPDGEEFEFEGFSDQMLKYFNLDIQSDVIADWTRSSDQLGQWVYDQAMAKLEIRRTEIPKEVMPQIVTMLMLQTIDTLWKDHLLAMETLKEGVGLRGYAQKDPVIEYKKEGYVLFEEMMFQLAADVVERVYHVELQTGDSDSLMEENMYSDVPEAQLQMQHAEPGQASRSSGQIGQASQPAPGLPRSQSSSQNMSGTAVRNMPKVGRNDPCPCGSAKKYKKCHG